MTKRIIILGTGGFARECHQWLLDIQSGDPSIAFRGFLDMRSNLADFPDLDSLYLGPEEDYTFEDNDHLVIGVGDPTVREKLYLRYRNAGVPFYSLVHPSAIIGRNCRLGQGNIICPGCVFTCDISIGQGNLFNLCTTLGHDVCVGDYNVISPHVDITGWARIGDLNTLGTSVVFLPKSQLGSRCKIAPGSVVYKGFKDNVIAKGNPATRIGENEA